VPEACENGAVAEASGRIVVGVDGSDGARRALAWAVEEARLRGWSIVAVHSYMVPPLLLSAETSPAGPPTIPDPGLVDRLADAAEKLLSRELEQADTDGVEVEGAVGTGPSADVLRQAAKDAQLLVVGNRGRGGFTGLLLGSVSQQVAQHSPCPVVIVPSGQSD
jgi:nucleotide-binding universal stress UspA family protein